MTGSVVAGVLGGVVVGAPVGAGSSLTLGCPDGTVEALGVPTA
ncbi:hypothetical protein [Micromonospora sp. M42]|nr:hypothetical protein [Micromonospora sp. M42]